MKNYETSHRLYMDRTVYIDELKNVDDLQDGECAYERNCVDYYKVNIYMSKFMLIEKDISGEEVKVLYVQRRADRLFAVCEDGVDRCVSGQGPYALKRFYRRKANESGLYNKRNHIHRGLS